MSLIHYDKLALTDRMLFDLFLLSNGVMILMHNIMGQKDQRKDWEKAVLVPWVVTLKMSDALLQILPFL